MHLIFSYIWHPTLVAPNRWFTGWKNDEARDMERACMHQCSFHCNETGSQNFWNMALAIGYHVIQTKMGTL